MTTASTSDWCMSSPATGKARPPVPLGWRCARWAPTCRCASSSSGITGELFAIEKYLPSIHIIQYGVDAIRERQQKLDQFAEKTSKFTFNPDEEEKDAARQGFEYAKKAISSGEYDMVILDEFNVVLKKGLIPVSEALELMKGHGHVEMVFTGRDAPQPVIDAADYCSNVYPVKHPWQKGIKARKGVEY